MVKALYMCHLLGAVEIQGQSSAICPALAGLSCLHTGIVSVLFFDSVVSGLATGFDSSTITKSNQHSEEHPKRHHILPAEICGHQYLIACIASFHQPQAQNTSVSTPRRDELVCNEIPPATQQKIFRPPHQAAYCKPHGCMASKPLCVRCQNTIAEGNH